MMNNDNRLFMNSDEKKQLQLELLQSTLNRAYRNVPFHKMRFKEMGIDISQIGDLKDLDRLPFMSRKHISENYPYNLFAVPLRDIVRIHTAPGTSQNPSVSGYTSHDLSIWRRMLARALKSAEVTPHDILQITLNPGLANWGRDYKNGAEDLEVSVIPGTPLSIEKKLMVLRDYKTSVLVTNPSSALKLGHYINQNDININTIELRTLIIVGDNIDSITRKKLQDQLNVKVWRHYGLSEVPGPAIAFECRMHEGLHVNDDYFLPEIIHPETGEVLNDDETGELVLTTLNTRAFPLIRFKTGDQAKIINHPCACGLSLKRIEWKGERTDNLLNIEGVKVHKNHILQTIQSMLHQEALTAEFNIKNRDGEKFLEVWIPVNDEIFSDEIKGLEALIQQAENGILDHIGVPVSIRLKERWAD